MYGVQAAIVMKPPFAIGETFWYAGTTVPDKCLECLGQEVSKTTYAKLYTAIGDLWATTGGASAPAAGNFRLPPSVINSTNVFVAGKQAAQVVGDSFAGQNESHTHTGTLETSGNHRHNVGYSNGGVTSGSDQYNIKSSGNSVYRTSTTNGAHQHTVQSISSSGATKARPQAAVFKLCIYTGVA